VVCVLGPVRSSVDFAGPRSETIKTASRGARRWSIDRKLPARQSWPTDGEAVCCEESGVPSFELLRYRHHDGAVFLYAFDLLELDGRDMRSAPLEKRRAALAKILRPVKHGVHLSDHFEADGPIVFRHACALGVEGIVSKRNGSPYRSGRTVDLDQGQEPGLASRQARCRRIRLDAVDAPLLRHPRRASDRHGSARLR
jgi:hypothetical protein